MLMVEDYGVAPLLTPAAVIIPLLLVLALTPAAVVTFSTLPPSPFACLAREGGQFLAAGGGQGKLGMVEIVPLGEWLIHQLPLAPDLTDFSSMAMEKVLEVRPLVPLCPRCQRPASLLPTR